MQGNSPCIRAFNDCLITLVQSCAMDRTDIALNDGRPSNASAASILLGVDAIIGRHLGCLDIGRSAPHFVHKAACLRLSTTPLPDLRACDLVREIGRTIHANWLQSDRRAAQQIKSPRPRIVWTRSTPQEIERFRSAFTPFASCSGGEPPRTSI